MTVYNMTSINGNAVPNQFIIEDGRRTVFQSYSSTIAVIDRDKKVIEIHPDWDYSMTTGKYRNMFFALYGYYRLSSKVGLVKAMNEGNAYGFRIVTK